MTLDDFALLRDGLAPADLPGYIPPDIDEKAPVAECCAAMRAAVITAYRATWEQNLRLVERRGYERGLADGRAGR